MIDAVRLTFAALREARPARTGDLNVRGVERGSPDVRLGLDHEGRPHLLVEPPETLPRLSPGSLRISARERHFGSARRCAGMWTSCASLSSSPRSSTTSWRRCWSGQPTAPARPVDVVREALDRWRSFFTAIGAPPARETLTAVVGELLLLRDVARITAKDVIAVWVGPRGGRHDLRRGLSAIEIKTTRSHTSRAVTIHGEDQLLPPEGGTLHLHLVRLEEVAGLGVCVADLVDELVDMGVPRLELFDALADAGVPPAAFPAVAGIRFDVRERLTFAVDEHMPRIVPDTFVGGQSPQGVLDVTYRIDLDHISHRALSDDAFRSLVEELAAPGEAR